MAKKVLTIIKLQIPGRQRQPRAAGRPRAGPARRQHHGVLQSVQRPDPAEGGTIIPVEITVYEDRSFDFITKTPPAAVLIKEAIGIPKGSGEPHVNKVGTISHGPGPPDRRAQDARPQRERHRRRLEDHRRHRPLDGRRRQKESPWPTANVPRAVRRRSTAPGLSARRGDRADQGDGERQVRRDGRAPHQARSQRPPRRGAAARHPRPPARARQGRRRSPSSPRVQQARDAEAAGADFVGGDDLPSKSRRAGPTSTSRSPRRQMSKVGKLGRVLGPQGKMPNPKVGTVTDDIDKAVTRQRPARSNTAPIGRRSSTSQWQGQLRRGGTARELHGGDRGDHPGQAGRRRRAATSSRPPPPRRWAPASGSTRPAGRDVRPAVTRAPGKEAERRAKSRRRRGAATA